MVNVHRTTTRDLPLSPRDRHAWPDKDTVTAFELAMSQASFTRRAEATRPFSQGVCICQILANMHLENYAPTGVELGEECSRFITEMNEALVAIKRNHLSRFPPSADFTIRGMRWLARRQAPGGS
jgi:hypothetical protein